MPFLVVYTNEDEWIEYHEPISRPVGAYTLFQPEEKNGRFYCQPDLPGNPQRLDIAKLEKDGLMESREIYYPKKLVSKFEKFKFNNGRE